MIITHWILLWWAMLNPQWTPGGITDPGNIVVGSLHICCQAAPTISLASPCEEGYGIFIPDENDKDKADKIAECHNGHWHRLPKAGHDTPPPLPFSPRGETTRCWKDSLTHHFRCLKSDGTENRSTENRLNHATPTVKIDKLCAQQLTEMYGLTWPPLELSNVIHVQCQVLAK